MIVIDNQSSGYLGVFTVYFMVGSDDAYGTVGGEVPY